MYQYMYCCTCNVGSVLGRSVDGKSLIFSFIPQSFLFNFLPDLSTFLDVFKYLAEPSCSGSSADLFFYILILMPFSVSFSNPLIHGETVAIFLLQLLQHVLKPVSSQNFIYNSVLSLFPKYFSEISHPLVGYFFYFPL
jgi:hypothetical protein